MKISNWNLDDFKSFLCILDTIVLFKDDYFDANNLSHTTLYYFEDTESSFGFSISISKSKILNENLSPAFYLSKSSHLQYCPPANAR